MNPPVIATMSAHSGLIPRKQAIQAGLPPDVIDRLLRTRTWVAVRRGVYAEATYWDSLDAYRQQPLHRARAASMNMWAEHVLSHDSAALALGLGILLPRDQLVHITRPDVHGSRTKCGVKHHLAPYHDSQVVEVDGLRVLDAARTAVDIAREHGFRHGICACDSALRAGVTRRQLERALEPMTCWPHVTQARAAVAFADPGAESVAETLGRELVTELGLGVPETQFGLTDGVRRVWCDLRLGRHVFEVDGRQKYRPVADGGLAAKDPHQVLRDEKDRQDFVSGFKLGVSRIVWDDYFGRAREWAKARLLREVSDTNARFGTSIQDLAPYIIRRPS